MNLLLSLLLFAGVLQAEFVPQSWDSRRQVKTTAAPYNVVVVDSTVYRSSRSRLNDLRLLHAGKEVPYVLRTLSKGREEKMFAPVMSNRVAIAGVGVQAVLDLDHHSPHNRVTINTDATNFRERVRVETSDDRGQWGTVRLDGTIFDVSTVDQHASYLSVSYPESTHRFLRITVSGWTNPAALQSAEVGFIRESVAERDIAADLRPNVTADDGSRESVIDCDLGFERPFDRVTFAVSAGLFSRPVTLSVSRDKKVWSTGGFGTLERTAREVRLTIEVPEQWDRYVRTVVRNNDNSPLSFTDVRFEAIRRELVFPAEEPGPYWLYSGNAMAAPVRYDLTAILPAQLSAIPVTLGPVERNPEYQPPSPPVTERSPWLLTALLLLMAPVIGIIAIRMLRQAKVSG